jgi:hypothetical protein
VAARSALSGKLESMQEKWKLVLGWVPTEQEELKIWLVLVTQLVLVTLLVLVTQSVLVTHSILVIQSPTERDQVMLVATPSSSSH